MGDDMPGGVWDSVLAQAVESGRGGEWVYAGIEPSWRIWEDSSVFGLPEGGQ
jgi:hypothetical protein